MNNTKAPASPLLKVASAADRFKLEIILVVVFIVATFLSPSFLTSGNLLAPLLLRALSPSV